MSAVSVFLALENTSRRPLSRDTPAVSGKSRCSKLGIVRTSVSSTFAFRHGQKSPFERTHTATASADPRRREEVRG